MLLGEFVHAGARSEVVRVLGATVQHDDQGNSLAGVAARDVELVGAGARAVGVRTLDEVSSSGTLTEASFPALIPGGSCTPRVRMVGPGVVHAAAPGRRSTVRRASAGSWGVSLTRREITSIGSSVSRISSSPPGRTPLRGRAG